MRFSLFILCFFTSIVWSDEKLFIEPDAGRLPLLQAIAHAQQEIDLVQYLFTDLVFARALDQAAERGVRVKVLLEKAPYQYPTANQWLVQYWQHSKIQWRYVPDSGSMINFYHQKTMIIDHKEIWVMTLNYVKSSFSHHYIERNFILYSNDFKQVAAIYLIFAQDWLNMQRKNNPLYLDANLVVSPDNALPQLIHLVQQAHKQIKIYAEGLDDQRFIQELMHAAAQGVVVTIIYSGRISPIIQTNLLHHGVHLCILQHLYNHAKVMIVDDQLAYLGSANFTTNALSYNRELGLVLSNRAIVHQLSAQFQNDYEASKACA